MEKAVIVISDLHIGGGKILPDGTINLLEDFNHDSRFADFLAYYCSGNYKDIPVELVINGDFFDLISIPVKGRFSSVETESHSLRKLKAIMSGHTVVVDALKKFLSHPKRSLTYIVGNHDMGMLWRSTRQHLAEQLKSEVNFRNIAHSFDGIHIEHGHQYEATNKVDPRRFYLKRDLPEPILNFPWATLFFINVVIPLKKSVPEITKVKPFRAYLRLALITNTLLALRIIFSTVTYFIKTRFFKNPRRDTNLKTTMDILKEASIAPKLEDAARKLLSDPKIHTVIFGHVHIAKILQWDEKTYFNIGTWTELTSLDLGALGQKEKLTFVEITFPKAKRMAENPSLRQNTVKLKSWIGKHHEEEELIP